MGLLLRKTKQVLGTFLLRPWPSPPPSPHMMSHNLPPHALPLPSTPATKEKAPRKGRKVPHTERPGGLHTWPKYFSEFHSLPNTDKMQACLRGLRVSRKIKGSSSVGEESFPGCFTRKQSALKSRLGERRARAQATSAWTQDPHPL